MEEFNVLYRGGPIEGFTRDQVRQALGDVLKVADKIELNHFFSGRPTALLKAVNRDAASALQQRLAKVGVKCDVEPVLADTDVKQDTGQAFEHLSLTPVPKSEAAETAVADAFVNEQSVPEVEPEGTRPASGGRAVFEARELSPESHMAAAPTVNATANLAPAAKAAAITMQLDKNTSGRGAGVVLPSDASGWCWGGFVLGWVWSVFNGTFIGLLTLVPVINLPVAIMLGIKGREWAWRNKRWQSVEHFNRVQRNWSIAGLVVLVVSAWFWFGTDNELDEAMQEMSSVTSAEMEQKLGEIDDPKAREQMRQLIEFQKQLEKQMETLQ